MAPCPLTRPTDATACLRDALVCEYGTDPRGDACRTFAKCSAGRWVVMVPDANTCPPITNIGACPVTPAGQVCANRDAYCNTAADRLPCHCTNCVDFPVAQCGTEYTWHCQAPNTVVGCPVGPADLGTACTMENLSCSYGCNVTIRLCQRGVWVANGTGPCPVSTRKAKRDIQYLSPTDIHAVADQILNVRLATYEYRDSPWAGRRHLGFVIEDSPGIPAVDRDHDMVDLYGYTSMLLAATQAQKQEIDDLRARLGRLQAEVAKLTQRRTAPPTPRARTRP
jgi:hypothetical protein